MSDDPLNIPYREREESITLERMGEPDEPVFGTELDTESTELFTINMGPHHPATHGVLRLLLTLEGDPAGLASVVAQLASLRLEPEEPVVLTTSPAAEEADGATA